MFGINKRNTEAKEFWKIIKLLDWKHEGDDDKVTAPAVDYLSKQSDDFIFRFDEQMAEYYNSQPDAYPYLTKTSYETGSNSALWEE